MRAAWNEAQARSRAGRQRRRARSVGLSRQHRIDEGGEECLVHAEPPREVVGELERERADGRAGIDGADGGKTLPSATMMLRHRVHAPAPVGDRSRGIRAHARRARADASR